MAQIANKALGTEVKDPVSGCVTGVMLIGKSYKGITTFPDPENGSLDVIVSSVIVTSDSTPGSCSMMVPDPEMSDGMDALYIPKQGDLLMVGAKKLGDNTCDIIFKGYIVDIAKSESPEGSFYTAKLDSMKGRLSDESVTKTYNENFNDVRNPNWSNADRKLKETPYTAKEIIEDMVDMFSSTSATGRSTIWSKTDIWFVKDDLKWDNAPGLEDFIPATMVFDGIPLLDAIYQVITTAGNYRMVYDAKNDWIVFSRMSLDCKNAGDERVVDEAIPAEDGEETGGGPAGDTPNVVSNDTVKSFKDCATIIRAVGAMVEWYSGHYYIKEGQLTADFTNVLECQYFLPSENWDGYEYYFNVANKKEASEGEAPGNSYIVVGAPLYPGWPLGQGFDPCKTKVKYKLEIDSTKAPQTYSPLTDVLEIAETGEEDEYEEGLTLLDKLFPEDSSALEKMGGSDLLAGLGMVYETWEPDKVVCPTCEGTGCKITEKPRLPWRDLCTDCKGAGIKPVRRIENISSSLVNRPPSKVVVDEYVQKLKDRTWEEAVSDLTYTYNPIVQCETTYANNESPAASEAKGSLPKHPLAGKLDFPADEKIKKLYKTQIIFNPDVKIDYKFGKVIFLGQGGKKERRGVMCVKRMFPLLRHAVKVSNPGKSDDGKIVSAVVCYTDKDDKPQYSKNLFSSKNQSFWRPAKVWMTYYYTRPRYYPDKPTEGAVKKGLKIKDDQGQTEKEGEKTSSFEAQMTVADGRFCYEIMETYADTETEFTSRHICKTTSINEYMFQVHPADAGKLQVTKPFAVVAATQGAEEKTAETVQMEAYKAAGYLFTHGRIHVNENKKASEQADGVAAPVQKLDPYVKEITWVHSDDRWKLLNRGMRMLEGSNNIVMSGNITVEGEVLDVSNGLGHVAMESANLVANVKASIVKIQYDLRDSFTTMYELSTEEARVGQMKEDEKQWKRGVDVRMNKLIGDGKKNESIELLAIGHPDKSMGESHVGASVIK
jgi:hypothetical protein